MSSAVQDAEQTESNVELVRDYLEARAQLLTSNDSLVTDEVGSL